MFDYAKSEQKQVSKNAVQKRETKNKSEPNLTAIPHQMKTNFENYSGFSFSDVRMHYNSDKPAQLQAMAYTQGNQVYVGSRREEHLEHELGHVVQQKEGIVKPTMQVNEVQANDNSEMERQTSHIECNGAIQRMVLHKSDAGTTCVVQRAGITITDGVKSARGGSSNDSDTKRKLEQWPRIFDTFEANVKTKTVNDSVRSPYHCAEPNSLANFLDKYLTIGKGTLEKLRFAGKATQFDSKTNTIEELPPCAVCQQWVDKEGLAIKSEKIVPAGGKELIESIEATRRRKQSEKDRAAKAPDKDGWRTA